MGNFQVYGDAPYLLAVFHGGPGEIGEMAPIASDLAEEYRVLEPFQTQKTLDGQVKQRFFSVLRQALLDA